MYGLMHFSYFQYYDRANFLHNSAACLSGTEVKHLLLFRGNEVLETQYLHRLKRTILISDPHQRLKDTLNLHSRSNRLTILSK